MPIATAIMQSSTASVQLAVETVRQAMRRAAIAQAGSVLLFLTPDFLRHLDAALKAVAEAAGTQNISGCTALGLLTEDDWVMDGPAVAAMVFSDGLGLAPVSGESERIAFAAPNAINTLWLDRPQACYGGVAGDFTGQGAYTVWSEATPAANGRIEHSLQGFSADWLLSFGLEALTPPLTVTASHELEILELDGKPAALPLWHALRAENATQRLPLLYALIPDEEPIPVISIHMDSGSVTLARPIAPGPTLQWALRTSDAALNEVYSTLQATAQSPRCGLLISSAGRGPHLHDGRDLEWEAICRQWPGMPMIGFYGNGEIAPFAGRNRVLTTSTLIGLFS